MSSVNGAAGAYVYRTLGMPLDVARKFSAPLACVVSLMDAVQAAFVAGVEHDATSRRAVHVDGVGAMPRATVRAGAAFLGDPSSALILRGRRLPGVPKPGHAPQMIVTVDARRGLDNVVAVDVDGSELARMFAALTALVVYGGEDVDEG